MTATVARLRRWAFGHAALYAPVAGWIAPRAVRHRGIGAISAATGMPDGGIVGESKHEILSVSGEVDHFVVPIHPETPNGGWPNSLTSSRVVAGPSLWCSSRTSARGVGGNIVGPSER